MGISGFIKKGFGIVGKSALLCLVALAVLFVAFFILGIFIALAVAFSNFPQMTPNMTQQEIGALNWSQVNWGLFVPVFALFVLLAGLVMSFIQGGLVAYIKDCIKEGASKIGSFFGNGVKFLMGIFLQYLIMIAAGVALVIVGAIIMTLIGLTNVTPLVVAAASVIFAVLALALLVYLAISLLYGQIALVTDNAKALKSLRKGIGFLNKNIGKSILMFIPFAIIFALFYAVGQGMAAAMPAMPVVVQLVLNFAVSFLQLLISVAMIASFMSCYMALAVKE